MRLPPDVTALLIKIKDYTLELGPVLLIAITIVTTLLTLLYASQTGWRMGVRNYLEAGLVRRTAHFLPPSNSKITQTSASVADPGFATNFTKNWMEAGTWLASPAALLTALFLSPVLFVIRSATGLSLLVSSWLVLGRLTSSFYSTNLFNETNTVSNQKAAYSTGKQLGLKKSLTKPAQETSLKFYLTLFKDYWWQAVDAYTWPALYNFLVAALLTIFVPGRFVQSWFGQGNLSGPLLVPVLGLFLARAIGSEMALVMALFTKGAGTGSGVTAMLTFPLLTISGLLWQRQRYGLKTTLAFLIVIWAAATALGVLLELVGVDANV